LNNENENENNYLIGATKHKINNFEKGNEEKRVHKSLRNDHKFTITFALQKKKEQELEKNNISNCDKLVTQQY